MKEPLNTIREKKDYLYKNLILVALLSVGMSLLANYYTNSYPFSDIPLWTGLACVLLSVLLYLISFYKNKSFKIKTDFVFVTDYDGKLIPIERYKAETSLISDLASVFSENKAYEHIWNKSFKIEPPKKIVEGGDEFISISQVDEKDIEKLMKRDRKGFELMTEAIEYTFLDWLSYNQELYFSSFEDDKNLVVLRRENIPEFLLRNRIIEVLSRPIEQREKFIDHLDDVTRLEDVHFLRGDDDAVYEIFELKLPKHSTLTKKDGWLHIKNRHYKLSFKGEFKGYNYQLPSGFKELYIGEKDIIVYDTILEFNIELNPWFFIMFNDWKYLNWIDIAYSKFLSHFSFGQFVKDIGYKEVATLFVINSKIAKRQQKAKAE